MPTIPVLLRVHISAHALASQHEDFLGHVLLKPGLRLQCNKLQSKQEWEKCGNGRAHTVKNDQRAKELGIHSDQRLSVVPSPYVHRPRHCETGPAALCVHIRKMINTW